MNSLTIVSNKIKPRNSTTKFIAMLFNITSLLCASNAFALQRNFNFTQTNEKISLSNNDKIVWQFNFSKDKPKTYFYPLATVDGVNLVAESPEDHLWHNGLFFQWKYIEKIDEKEKYNLYSQTPYALSIPHLSNQKYLFWEPSLHSKDNDNILLGTSISVLKSAKLNKDFSAEIVVEVFYCLGKNIDTSLLKERRDLKISSPDQNGTYFIDWTASFIPMYDIILSASEIQKNYQGGYAGLSVRMDPNCQNAEMFNLLGGKITEYDNINQMKTCMDKKSPAIATNAMFNGVSAGIVLIESKESDNAFSPNYSVFRKVENEKNLNWIFMSMGYLRNSPKNFKRFKPFHLKYRVIIHSNSWSLKQVKIAEKIFNK